MGRFAFFYMITTSCASTVCENAVFFPLDGFSPLVEDQVTIGVWVHFWSSILFHWSTCLSLYHYHDVFITIAL